VRQWIDDRRIEPFDDAAGRAIGYRKSPGRPASSTLISGGAVSLDLAVTANALIFPARSCGKELDTWSNKMSICRAPDPQ
jgi:hypothetical protein